MFRRDSPARFGAVRGRGNGIRDSGRGGAAFRALEGVWFNCLPGGVCEPLLTQTSRPACASQSAHLEPTAGQPSRLPFWIFSSVFTISMEFTENRLTDKIPYRPSLYNLFLFIFSGWRFGTRQQLVVESASAVRSPRGRDDYITEQRPRPHVAACPVGESHSTQGGRWVHQSVSLLGLLRQGVFPFSSHPADTEGLWQTTLEAGVNSDLTGNNLLHANRIFFLILFVSPGSGSTLRTVIEPVLIAVSLFSREIFCYRYE